MKVQQITSASFTNIGMPGHALPRPIFDVDVDIRRLCLASLIVTLLAVSVFVAKDVKRQKILSFLLSCVLAGVIAVSGTVFVVSVLMMSETVL